VSGSKEYLVSREIFAPIREHERFKAVIAELENIYNKYFALQKGAVDRIRHFCQLHYAPVPGLYPFYLFFYRKN
jgi:NADH:ubiquinone oxidoreductase subunit E